MFGLKKSGELVQRVLRLTATGWQVHCHVLLGSLLAWLFPQVRGGHSNRYTGPGVWWPNLGRIPGRDPPVTARFQPNFSAGVWQAPHKPIKQFFHSMNWGRENEPRVSLEQEPLSSGLTTVAASSMGPALWCCLHIYHHVHCADAVRQGCSGSTCEGPANTTSCTAGGLILSLCPWPGWIWVANLTLRPAQQKKRGNCQQERRRAKQTA